MKEPILEMRGITKTFGSACQAPLNFYGERGNSDI